MPVFWFALSCISNIHWGKAILIGVILHVIIYPSSNGYNSYMDRDTDSVGGIKNPLQPTKQLFYVSIVLDVLAIVLSLFISKAFVALILLYIVCSRLYSYRKVRIKQYAILGYLTVIVNQGAVVFWLFIGVLVQTLLQKFHGYY
jgi:1,4-dihydroxy-2-naphthoate octaprenyltransferase